MNAGLVAVFSYGAALVGLSCLAFGACGCASPQTAVNAVLTTEELVCVTAQLSEGGTAAAHDLAVACGIAQALEPVVADVIQAFWSKRADIRAARGNLRGL